MHKPELIVLAYSGGLDTSAIVPWLRELAPEHRPQRVLVAIDAAEAGLPPGLDKPAAPGRVNAYVCRGVTCLAPVSEIGALRKVLETGEIK